MQSNISFRKRTIFLKHQKLHQHFSFLLNSSLSQSMLCYILSVEFFELQKVVTNQLLENIWVSLSLHYIFFMIFAFKRILFKQTF